MNTVNDVLRLYYGARCVIAYEVAAKTITEGCFRGFPTAGKLSKSMLSRPVAKEMWGLLHWFQQDGREVTVTYLELCMMYRFFGPLPTVLWLLWRWCVNNIQEKPKLWKYTQHMQKNEV